MSLKSAFLRKTNNSHYIQEKLQNCRGGEAESRIVNTFIKGPKFFAVLSSAEDTIRFINDIPYLNRKGTVTFVRPESNGFRLFTGGKISKQEALSILELIKNTDVNHGAYFYDWSPSAQ
ncbi:MAG: hypothetical protein ACOX7P_07775 [Oscillospiraceae bacterium]|jgi:hypothetical protein